MAIPLSRHNCNSPFPFDRELANLAGINEESGGEFEV